MMCTVLGPFSSQSKVPRALVRLGYPPGNAFGSFVYWGLIPVQGFSALELIRYKHAQTCLFVCQLNMSRNYLSVLCA